MPFPQEIKDIIYNYCNNHLGDENWFNEEFEFIEDEKLRERLVQEFKGIRFAYKIYEGIEADKENLIFEIRHQIIAYATIYEAVIHYVLYTYYQDTDEFHNLTHFVVPTKISISDTQKNKISSFLLHNNEELIPCKMQERKKNEIQVRFDDKCIVAENLGLIKSFTNDNGDIIDFKEELIEIYSYRNAIHLVAELRKGIEYELNLSKKAYRRMRPFIDQIKSKLKKDNKSIYK